ncbi:NTP transferase domain-containing protein [Paenibacillus thailandensis]|uniref:NTP transferase domain-containing protein n=1 Tax=Paenibacillus thailandensis TaxID=393250 RepID=A0ABW5R3N2_9BACL
MKLPDGMPLGAMALRALFASGAAANPVYVVVRPDDDLQWLRYESGLSGRCSGSVHIALCPDAARGMSYSIRCGIQAAEAEEPDALLIMLADQPFVSALHLKTLASEYMRDQDADYAASIGREGVPMPPVIIGRKLLPQLSRLEGDMGARKLLQSPGLRGTKVPVRSEAELLDIDDAEGYRTAAEFFVRQYRESQ